MADAFAFTRDSAQRIANAVRAVENTPAINDPGRYKQPPSRQLQLFRRTDGTSPISVTSGTVQAVQVWDVPGYDYEALTSPCLATVYETPPDVPETAPSFDVDAQTFYLGVILPGEMFLATKIGDKWYAVGSSHTAIVGTISPGQTIRIGCEIDIPFRFLATPTQAPAGVELEGAVGLADWATPLRAFVLVAWDCPDDLEL